MTPRTHFFVLILCSIFLVTTLFLWFPKKLNRIPIVGFKILNFEQKQKSNTSNLKTFTYDFPDDDYELLKSRSLSQKSSITVAVEYREPIGEVENLLKPSKKFKTFNYTKLEYVDTSNLLNNNFKNLTYQPPADEDDFELLNDTSILPPSARIVAKKIFKERSLVILATEWHMTPIKDLKNLLEPFGVIVLDYNLDPWRCEWHDCEARKRLKVLNSDNVLEANPPIPEKFYNAYKNDSEMRSVDVVFCGFPASICEIYITLNKSVLVLPSTRYDVGRYTVDRWNKLNENLRILAEKPWNVFGGNNLYDANYLKYYTGIETQHFPSVCDYTGAEYNYKINTFLVLRRRDRGFNKIFFDKFDGLCRKPLCPVKLKMIEGYSYKDLAQYKGIIHVPYQISVMSIFEQYRMNIPMFFPSPELLSRWQVDHYIMPERSFDGAFFNKRPNASTIPPHPSQTHVPDPKNEYDYNSTLYWIKFADFYQVFPYGFIYNSMEELVDLLSTVDNNTLQQTSQKMRTYNIQFKKEIIKKWKSILLNYANHTQNSISV